MIRFVEMKCKNCGAQLKTEDGRIAFCDKCGSTFLIDTDQPLKSPQQKPVSEHEKATSSKKLAIILGGILILVFTSVILIPTLFRHKSAPVTESPSWNSSTVSTSEESLSNHLTSPLFRLFAADVFAKKVDDITEDQLNSLLTFSITKDGDGFHLTYTSNEQQEEETYHYPSDTQVDYVDLHLFTNLTKLNVSSGDLEPGCLDGLTNLTDLTTTNNIYALTTIIDPSQLTRLELTSETYDLEGISNYINLTSLSMDRFSGTDLKALSSLKNLTSLSVLNCDTASDFSVLSTLTGLEKLSLECSQIKDISFVKQMNSLTEFSLVGSIIIDLSPLKEKESLTQLTLKNNDEIKDYTVIDTLTDLTSLTLRTYETDASFPDFYLLQDLSTLDISGMSSIEDLQNPQKLKKLTVRNSDCTYYNVLTYLPSLEELTLNNIWGDIPGLDFLQNIPSLKYLDLSSMELYGDVQEIFQIPTLETLILNDASIGIDPTKITEIVPLKKLEMNRVKLWTNVDVTQDGYITQLDYDDVALESIISMFQFFPNLEELDLESAKLTNLDFTKSLQKLKLLNVDDNYITDLRPLANLPHLETVWCRSNAITQGKDLNNVTIISE